MSKVAYHVESENPVTMAVYNHVYSNGLTSYWLPGFF